MSIAIIEKPLLTEKMNRETEKRGTYGFIVDRKADKPAIKKAVEELYGVHVEKVNTMVVAGKNKTRFTKHGVLAGKTKAHKKAIVWLREGESIDFFSNF